MKIINKFLAAVLTAGLLASVGGCYYPYRGYNGYYHRDGDWHDGRYDGAYGFYRRDYYYRDRHDYEHNGSHS